MVYSSTPLPSSSSELLKKACEASGESQGLISVVQGVLWPRLQARTYGAGLLFHLHSEVASGFSILDRKERPQQRPIEFLQTLPESSCKEESVCPKSSSHTLQPYHWQALLQVLSENPVV